MLYHSFHASDLFQDTLASSWVHYQTTAGFSTTLLATFVVPLSRPERSRGSIYENERYEGKPRGYLPLENYNGWLAAATANKWLPWNNAAAKKRISSSTSSWHAANESVACKSKFERFEREKLERKLEENRKKTGKNRKTTVKLEGNRGRFFQGFEVSMFRGRRIV